MKLNDFDILVVGAGHAGIEACMAAARLGLRVGVVTTNLQRIGFMSCNPSIGGLGKGHIVKEIDALGGEMGRAADVNCIQFKRLNSRKGPAVRGSRAQCDKDLYSVYMGELLKNHENIRLIEAEAKRLILENHCCRGVVLEDGSKIRAQIVIITTGTFMRAVMHFGLEKMEGGRIGDKSTIGISDQLSEYGFQVIRLKTGTPPRLKKNSINWDVLKPQSGDERFIPFSYRSKNELSLPQILCHLAYTNEHTHQIIRDNLNRSPMLSGDIKGVGPRYCPSIEDKITRFPDKNYHQTFLEPESLNTDSIYLQGISTSLPVDIQDQFLRTMAGLESVEIIRPGYAVEYDCIEPIQISHSLETRLIKNLFLAGQINGTSGYEEAAGQGLVAGTNAALKVLEKSPLILRRDEAYIGVLVDDLVTKGTREPYRMMTARAEFRLNLREDNVLERLADKAKQIGLLRGQNAELAENIMRQRQELLNRLKEERLVPNQETQLKLQELGTPTLTKPQRFSEFLRRPEIGCLDLKHLGLEVNGDEKIWEPVEIQVKYSGYISRQQETINQAQKMEEVLLPDKISYNEVLGLSLEEVEKLSQIRPRTLGQANRISGVNPSAIQALVLYIKAKQRRQERKASPREVIQIREN